MPAVLTIRRAEPRSPLSFEYADMGLCEAHRRAVLAAARQGRSSVKLYERGELVVDLCLRGFLGADVMDRTSPLGSSTDWKSAASGG